MRQMLSLGGFVFSLGDGTAYESLQRTSGGGWVVVSRFGQKPVSQHTGSPLDVIVLSGSWFRGEGMLSVDGLRALQAKAEPLVLVDGYGGNHGLWTIKKIQEKQGSIIDDGTAFVVSFTLELEEFSGAKSS